MILQEEIKDYNGKVIKIGFAKGSNYIFCDKCTPKTIDILTEIEDVLIRNTRYNLKRSIATKRYLENTGVDEWVRLEMEKIRNRKLRSGMKEREIEATMPPRSFLVDKYNSSLETLTERIARYEECLAVEHPVIEANVEETYPSIEHDNEFSLICHGFFNGAFWNVDEYKAGYDKVYGEEAPNFEYAD